MLRRALQERMAVRAHVEARDTPVYAMVVGRAGHPGLRRSLLDTERVLRDTQLGFGALPSGDPSTVITNLVYPLADLHLLGFVVVIVQ